MMMKKVGPEVWEIYLNEDASVGHGTAEYRWVWFGRAGFGCFGELRYGIARSGGAGLGEVR